MDNFIYVGVISMAPNEFEKWGNVTYTDLTSSLSYVFRKMRTLEVGEWLAEVLQVDHDKVSGGRVC